MALAAPRVSRAKIGTAKMPIATMALIAPGPSVATSMIASRMAGKANMKSDSRIRISSVQPRRADAHRPRATPNTMPMLTATTPTVIEFCAPAMMIDRVSRPNWSVPSQWSKEGGASRLRTLIRVGS